MTNRFARAIPVASLFLVLGAGASLAQGAADPSTPAAAAPAVPKTATAAQDLTASEWWASGRYRLTPTDVIELTFPFVPELDQVLTVQPDGYVSVRPVGDLRVQGRSMPELRQMLLDAFAPIVREPRFTIVLREFEKPYFVVAGEVKSPGKFDLRGAVTVTQGLALAGGTTTGAKSSQIVLFRRYTADMVEVKQFDVKKMLADRNLSEDQLLRPGDTLFVPRSVMARLKPYLPSASIGLFLNPFDP